MGIVQKLNRMQAKTRDSEEIGHWFTSLAPLIVAFTFFIVFVSTSAIPNKVDLYVMGAAAGFSGLQIFWIVRGWRRDEATTVILGFLGIAIAVGLAWFYMRYQPFRPL